MRLSGNQEEEYQESKVSGVRDGGRKAAGHGEGKR